MSQVKLQDSTDTLIKKSNSCNLTAEQLVVACRNIGFDLRCGSCASLFYTGYDGYQHDDNCHTAIPDNPDGGVALPDKDVDP